MAITTEPVKLSSGKVFICSGVSCEWREIGTVNNDSMIVDEQRHKSPFTFGEVSLTFTMKKRDRIRLLQEINILDRPKCTYKTIRRDCAKRNRR